MSTDIQNKLSQYIEYNKQLGNLRSQLKDLKKETQNLYNSRCATCLGCRCQF